MITANNTFFGLQRGTRVSLQDRFVKFPLSKGKLSQFNTTHLSQESWESTITSIPKKDPKTKDLLVNVVVINACFSHLSGSQNHCVLADLRIITAREHSLTNSSRLCCWFQDSKKKTLVAFFILCLVPGAQRGLCSLRFSRAISNYNRQAWQL